MSTSRQAPEEALSGGPLLAAITNRIVALVREHFGRGPIKAKAYLCDDLLVIVLSDGFTPAERTLAESGQEEQVLTMRRSFQDAMEGQYSAMIEELTGRKVLAFLSQTHVAPDLTTAMFRMDAPLRGFGALELIDASHPTGVDH